MQLLWKYLKAQSRLIILVVVFMFFAVIFELMQPTLMAMIVDRGIGQSDPSYIIRYSFLMFITSILGFLCAIISYFLSAKSSAKIGELLREDLFRHVLAFSHYELDQLSVSTLITRLTNDVSQIQNLLLTAQRIFFRSPFMLIGGLVFAMRLSASLSIIFLFAIPALFLCLAFVMHRALKIYPLVQKSLDIMNAHVRESILGIRVIKGFRKETKANLDFREKNLTLYRHTLKAQLNNLILSPFIMIIFNFSMVAILWMGGYQVAAGQLEIGKIMAFVTYMSQILNAVLMSAMVFIMISSAKVSIDRIKEVFETNPMLTDGHDEHLPSLFNITFQNVWFSYNETQQPSVLKDISLSIQANERIGIIGATGSGKSALVSLIPRLYDPTDGHILIGGVDIKNLSLKSLRHMIGFVSQESMILSGSIEENLRLARPDATIEDMKDALQAAQLDELFRSNAHRDLKQRGLDLSGGQKQRLALARVFLMQPPILIIDDATSALDVITEDQILTYLDEEKHHQTQLIVSHRISTMARCDRVIFIMDGRISGFEHHDTLLINNEAYRQIANSQLRGEALHA